MKSCIIIASHLYYDNQINYLYRCLLSLLNQINIEYKPKIYVSLSYSSDKYLTELKNIILNNSLFKDFLFNICDCQKYQMEHIYIITKIIKDTNSYYDLIFFCDDDDTYVPNRMSLMINHYKQDLIYNNHINGVREICNQDIGIDKIEYWSYAVKPYILNKFFDNFKNDTDLLKTIFADMYLREYLKNNISINKYAVLNTEQRLYLYTNDNNNSVCSTLRKGDIFKRLSNQMFLYAIANRKLHSNLNTKYMRENLLEIEDIINKLEKIIHNYDNNDSKDDDIININDLYFLLNNKIEDNKQLLIHLNSYIFKEHPDNFKISNIKNNIEELKYNIPLLHPIINELELKINPELDRIRLFNLTLYNK